MKASPLSQNLRTLTAGLSHTHYQLVVAAADFADSDEWAHDGSPTAAHWLAGIADVETCTAREWIRIGRALRLLHASADAFANGRLSYAKVRALTRFTTPDNEHELLELALNTTANHLPRAVMRSTPAREPDGTWPTLAQQYADALITFLTAGVGGLTTELVLHVRGDGCTLDDGTPIPDTIVERIARMHRLRPRTTPPLRPQPLLRTNPPHGDRRTRTPLPLPIPDEPLARLWRATDLLREALGDAHIIAWSSEGLSPLEVGLLGDLYWDLAPRAHTAGRGWLEAQLSEAEDHLRSTGLLADSSLTDEGFQLRYRIEVRTDDLMSPAVRHLGGELDNIADQLDLWSASIVAAGGYLSPAVRFTG